MKRQGDKTAGLRDALRTQISRRQTLGALGFAGLGGAAWTMLAGMARADDLMGPGGIPLARPDRPVKLPLYEDSIKSGLQPETGGVFNVFNVADYLDKKVLQDFGKKYGVEVQLTTMESSDQGISKLATGAIRPDVTELTPDRLSQAVAAKLLKPVNLDYVPNLKRNVWPSLHSPFYDLGSQYTVPYTVYSTGIGWRADKIGEDVAKLDNPWSIFWHAQKYTGYVGLLDSTRELLALALLYRRNFDVNTEDPAVIGKALADLKALIPICNPKINQTDYQTLADGSSWLHQAWSGDLLACYFSYLPKGDDGSNLRYWAAPKGKGPVQNDCWAICASTTKPVLAHLWLNFLLDEGVAYGNFVNFTGYQPPQNAITPDALVAKKVVPENLRQAVMTAEDMGPGSLQEMSLTVKGRVAWQDAIARFKSGA